jgi:hypothetical protein
MVLFTEQNHWARVGILKMGMWWLQDGKRVQIMVMFVTAFIDKPSIILIIVKTR